MLTIAERVDAIHRALCYFEDRAKIRNAVTIYNAELDNQYGLVGYIHTNFVKDKFIVKLFIGPTVIISESECEASQKTVQDLIDLMAKLEYPVDLMVSSEMEKTTNLQSMLH